MRVLNARNVGVAYHLGLQKLATEGVREDSRNGPVIVLPSPLTTVYERPTERVLFNRGRDANPFFHMMEAIWMLAGRNDAAFPARYAKQIGEYAESDGVIHGAYGHRWRLHFHTDQLKVIETKLRANYADRQCVLQMWDASSDVDFGGTEWKGNDLVGNWKDRPCNTHVYFRVRQQQSPKVDGAPFFSSLSVPVLDMTVCCRSNDMIWGGWGANAVHFSVLQEYLAAAVGVQVGRYYQVSNNAHVYDNDLLRRCLENKDLREPYSDDAIWTKPMVTVPDRFLEDCETFCDSIDDLWSRDDRRGPPFHNVWFNLTAWNAALAHYYFKQGNVEIATSAISAIDADDWRLACAEWINRRTSK